MKKGAWFAAVVLGCVFLANIVAAGNNSTVTQPPLISPPSSSSSIILDSSAQSAASDKGYSCLANQITNKTSISLQEATFGLLALGSQSKLEDVIQNSKNGQEACWPKTGCTIKETAQVLLANNHRGTPTTDIEQWLLSKKILPTELTWYLEIDSTQKTPAACTIRYDGREYHTNIKEDMTFSGGAGSCLAPSSSGYWLRVNNQCLAKSFEISCDQDFVTTFLYQKGSGATVYVSSSAHAAPSLGTTNESISIGCFGTGATCDYEDSLWAALALQKANKDVGSITPYLLALSEDNQKYFASAFLYILTSDADQYTSLLQSRKQNQFWEFTGGRGRFYDTSLGLLALGTSTSPDSESTKAYLLGIQQSDGCWNNDNVRDTAFILYAGWPRNGGGGGGGGHSVTCAEEKLFCQLPGECTQAQGTIQQGYECPGVQVCCTQQIQHASCTQQNGKLCRIDETCSGTLFKASDGDCCVGTCESAPTPPESQCEISAKGSCRSSCSSGETQTSEQCSGNSVCCVTQETKGWPWFWIIILVLLIGAVIAAILYRDALRMWLFKRRGKASSTPIVRPGVPPSSPPSFARPVSFGNRFRPAPSRAPQPAHRPSKDSEMEETLRKLREMSK